MARGEGGVMTLRKKKRNEKNPAATPSRPYLGGERGGSTHNNFFQNIIVGIFGKSVLVSQFLRSRNLANYIAHLGHVSVCGLMEH